MDPLLASAKPAVGLGIVVQWGEARGLHPGRALRKGLGVMLVLERDNGGGRAGSVVVHGVSAEFSCLSSPYPTALPRPAADPLQEDRAVQGEQHPGWGVHHHPGVPGSVCQHGG